MCVVRSHSLSHPEIEGFDRSKSVERFGLQATVAREYSTAIANPGTKLTNESISDS